MNINELLDVERQIIPEALELLEKRHNIMKIIEINQPIGRRNLAMKFGTTERIIRSEVDKLKEIGIIKVESSGMTLTNTGKNIVSKLDKIIFGIKGISEIEAKLKDKLGLKKVAIVPGDIEKDEFVYKDLGKKAARIIKNLLEDNTIIGITGGTTMACVSQEMKEVKGINNILVVPARGGLGEALEIQANTIAANLAEKLNAEYRLLHIPDNIDSKTLDFLKENKLVRDVLSKIQNINLLVFGLGNAFDMAKRRNLNENLINKIYEYDLVGEAFGYYFDRNGTIKMQTNSAGISIRGLNKISKMVGVAAGKHKAEAIYAISKINKEFILVTDEGAARKILSL